jgi:hypothetical protein
MRPPVDLPPSPLPEEPSAGRAATDGPADSTDDGDRVSVTDVNGSIARFEMTYSPPGDQQSRAKFGPPWRTRLPSALYLALALALGAVVLYAYTAAPSSSIVFAWVVERDRGRPLSASVLATVIVVSALATVLRTHMRGVLVAEDWIEARYLLPLGIPRARRWGWPQVLRVVIDGTRVAFELWDGSFERLPEVANGRELVELIVRHAQRRRIQVTALDATPR